MCPWAARVRCFGSRFLGSKQSFEIIVIDDNSPDGTQQVAEKLQQLYGADKIVSNMMLRCRCREGLDNSPCARSSSRARESWASVSVGA
jgi:hypothetical protein